MRYLINDKFVDGNDAPILFYCGNEDDVDVYYANTGYITDTLPASMKALVVFGEHRYYGKSMPFGDKSFIPENVRFLTVYHTMMDYVKLIQFIKYSDVKYKNSPVIAVGGSYGGMMASWMRMKYPHIIAGAYASSAPILFFQGTVSPYAYNDLVTRTFRDAV